ncbi:MAG TPA: hypothetical protein VH089_02620 [Streptosporangiaceae bacterium]|nr:hypothetical protein [Streptosporangiaceae bacterium]
MFVAHDVLLDVSFAVARPRLVTLTSGRALADASRAAYAEGLAGQPGVAPNAGANLGHGAGLARVRYLPPVERRDSVTVGLRWETSGEVAGLFPVLDADITLAAAGEHSATLTVSGVYRPPWRPPCPALLAAPVLHGAPGPDSLPPEPSGPGAGPVADIAVRALLRYAAVHLTGSAT